MAIEISHPLQEYAASGSQEAFAQIVPAHFDLVHNAAVRQVSDTHLAQEAGPHTLGQAPSNKGLFMRPIPTFLTCAALSLIAATAWAQTIPAPAPATTPATGRGRGFAARSGGFGGQARGADQPVIQTGADPANSLTAHEQHLTKARLGKGKIDVYFEGDSIFRRWGCSDPAWAMNLKNWNDNFFGWNAGDFAWGADQVQNILWRLLNGEIDDVNPKIVVFLGGTNNLNPGGGDNNVADIIRGLTACFDTIHKKAPDATLVIVGILPRLPANDMPIINKINDNLSRMADGNKTRFVNVNDKFMDQDGRLVPGILNSDNIHPDVKGYQAIADALKPIFTEILGPPAKEDHAPPPSGDPKVRPDYPPKSATAPAAATAPTPNGR